MNNNENNNNVKTNEQQEVAAPVENKKSWFGTAISAVKNTAGTVTSFAKEHKTMTAVGVGVITIGTIALVVLKKKGNANEPATDAEGFDNK